MFNMFRVRISKAIPALLTYNAKSHKLATACLTSAKTSLRLAISILIKLFQNNKVKKDNFIKDYGRLRYMEVCSKPCYIFSITLSSKERKERKLLKALKVFQSLR